MKSKYYRQTLQKAVNLSYCLLMWKNKILWPKMYFQYLSKCSSIQCSTSKVWLINGRNNQGNDCWECHQPWEPRGKKGNFYKKEVGRCWCCCWRLDNDNDTHKANNNNYNKKAKANHGYNFLYAQLTLYKGCHRGGGIIIDKGLFFRGFLLL